MAAERVAEAARRNVRELVAANDPALRRLIEAESEEERDAEIARLLVHALRPVRTLDAGDAEDVAATAALRLVRRLRAVAVSGEDAIVSFPAYVETVVHNAAQEVMKRRFPARNRLRNRLRYVLTHDDRFALWRGDDGRSYAGLRRWQQATPVDRPFARAGVPDAACHTARPAEALLALLRHLGGPLPFDQLVDITAELWNVTEGVEAEPETDPGDVLARLISQHSLAAVWREIGELREPQRAALLLNLRDDAGLNAAGFLVVAGVATFEQLAAAMGMSPERLAEIWSDLPLDDNSIAAALGVTRQQVINLRKSARERLRRRLGVTK